MIELGLVQVDIRIAVDVIDEAFVFAEFKRGRAYAGRVPNQRILELFILVFVNSR